MGLAVCGDLECEGECFAVAEFATDLQGGDAREYMGVVGAGHLPGFGGDFGGGGPAGFSGLIGKSEQIGAAEGVSGLRDFLPRGFEQPDSLRLSGPILGKGQQLLQGIVAQDAVAACVLDDCEQAVRQIGDRRILLQDEGIEGVAK